jgi:arylsulfatase A-like enzyme
MKLTTAFPSLIAVLAGAALFNAIAPAHAADKKPNIVHIVADDLGWKDVGFNGATDIKTPNIDALAAGGAKFTQFYVQPMCTPTRAALMTGRYPFRYGLQTMVIPSVSTYGLDNRVAHAAVPQGSRLQDRDRRQVASGPWRQEVLAEAARL